MDDWAELDRALDAMAASGSAEVREDGEWLADFAALHCELRGQGMNCARSPLVRRTQSDPPHPPHQGTIRRSHRSRSSSDSAAQNRDAWNSFAADSPRPPGRITREQFRARLRRILAEHFPDADDWTH